MKKGYVHIYTGDGKGKTTSAIGLSVRALGAGLKVYFAQFVKGQIYNEIKALKRFEPQLICKRYGAECFIYHEPREEDFRLAAAGWKEVRQLSAEGEYDLIVLDEINIAVYYNLISQEQVLEFIDNKPLEQEIVLTGRKMPDSFLKKADLVTEMKEIKHYYQKGVEARPGIEF